MASTFVSITDKISKPMTLESLQQKYTFEVMTPATASMAIADRLAIIRECDCKGYHTEEDLKMMDYLMRVRNAIVDHIIKHEHKRIDSVRSGLFDY